MKFQDFKEIGLWTVVTAISITGLFGAKLANSAQGDTGKQPSAIVDGSIITAVITPTNRPGTLRVDMNLINPGDQTSNMAADLVYERQTYQGNPMSRAPSTSDYKIDTLASVPIRQNLAPHTSYRRSMLITIGSLQPTAQTAPPARRGPAAGINQVVGGMQPMGRQSPFNIAPNNNRIAMAPVRQIVSASPRGKGSAGAAVAQNPGVYQLQILQGNKKQLLAVENPLSGQSMQVTAVP